MTTTNAAHKTLADELARFASKLAKALDVAREALREENAIEYTIENDELLSSVLRRRFEAEDVAAEARLVVRAIVRRMRRAGR